MISRAFLLFVAAGGTAAAVNVAARIVLNLAMPYDAAIVVAYLAGMTTAFVLNRVFVFRATGAAAGGQFVRFALVNVVAVAQVWAVSVALARGLFPAIGFTWQAHTVAHAIGVASPIVTSYLLHKHFSFGAPRAEG